VLRIAGMGAPDGQRILLPARPSSQASCRGPSPRTIRVPVRPATLRSSLPLPSFGTARDEKEAKFSKDLPPTPRLGSEASDEELAAGISVVDTMGQAMVGVKNSVEEQVNLADQGRQAVSDLFTWMQPLRRATYAKGLTTLAFEIEERSQEWSAYLGGRCSRKESLDAISGEAAPPKDFSTTAEAASLILRLVRALPRGFALRTMLEPLLQELMEAIFCDWPRTLPSLQDLKEEDIWPTRLGLLSTYAQQVSGYRAGLAEAREAQLILEERAKAASAIAKTKSRENQELARRIIQLEAEMEKCSEESRVAKKNCQEAEESYETFKQQTKYALIDYSEMQHREATMKSDLSNLNIICREKDITIQDLRNQVTSLTHETQDIEEKLRKAREDVDRQAALVEQLPTLQEELKYYTSEEAVHGVAYARRVATEVLGKSLEDIVAQGTVPPNISIEKKQSAKLAPDAAMESLLESLRSSMREADKLKEQVAKSRHLLEEIKRLVPVWNESAMQDVADAYDEDAAVHRQVYSMSDKRHFAGLGLDDSVPMYLRAEGPVRHRYISKKECEDLIEGFLAEAPAEMNADSMHTELYYHMQRQFTDAEELTEFAYAFVCSLEAYRDDPDFELFDLMLAGAVHPAVMQDQESLLRELQNLVHNCADGSLDSGNHTRGRGTLTGTKASGRDQVTRRVMRGVMQAMFPEKSVERMNSLMRALHVSLQMLFDAGRSATPDTAYVSDLFSATADGTQSPLIEEIRRQHLHEVLEFTALISQNLIRAAGGETFVNLTGRLDANILITREATARTFSDMGIPESKAMSMLEYIWKPSDEGSELQVEEVLHRLRRQMLLKREDSWVLAGPKAVVEKVAMMGSAGGKDDESGTSGVPRLRRNRAYKVLDNPFAKGETYNTPQGLLREVRRSAPRKLEEDGDEAQREEVE